MRPTLRLSIRRIWLPFLMAATSLVCSQALALGSAKPLKQYGRQSWQSDTGLPQNTVHAIVQSGDGYIWLATEGGLVRFDGQELRTFDAANTRELPSGSINDLVVDGRGALWISTSGGLVRREGERFTPMTTANGLPSNTVRFVRVRRGGGLLVATASGVALGDANGFRALPGIGGEIAPALVTEDAAGTLWIAHGQQIFSLPAGANAVSSVAVAKGGEIHAIAADASGGLWVGGRNGVALLRNGGKVPIDIGDAGRNMNVSSLLALRNGDVWIGTEAGLFEYTHGAMRRVGDTKGGTAGRVLRLFADREGAVWVAYDLGVSRVADGLLQYPIDIPGVLSIFEDREGDMWFGTDVGGATVLREQAFSTLTTQDGLSDDFVRAVFEDHAGTMWLGTNRGGLNRIAQGQISAIGAGKGDRNLSSNVVLALAEAEGDLWIGTPDGLNRLHQGKMKLFTTADGLPDDFVRSLYTDTDGSLWIGTRNGLSHYAHGGFTSYSRLDGLGSDLIGGIVRGRDGTLWVGTLNGLSRFDGAGFKNFTMRDGLGGDAITTLAEDRDGTLWIASHTAGLTRLRGGRFTAIDSAKAGLPEEIYSVLEDGSGGEKVQKQIPCGNDKQGGGDDKHGGGSDKIGGGNDKQGGGNDESSDCGVGLWLASSKGVYRVPLDGLNALVEGRAATVGAQSFGVADGMKISECSSGGHPAAWRMSDGSLWFATLKGAASIRPASDYENRVSPLTAIEDVLIDDQAVPPDRPLTVEPGHDRIAIHYAGLSFRTPRKLGFRYKLEGFDREWIDAGARRTAFYTNLPAGSYRFIVYSSNGDGVWSEVPGEFRFKIRPHFYRTIWFYAAELFFVGLLAWLIYRARVRAVQARYQAVLAERNRIAREIHDTLAQGYVGISVQLEVASRLLQSSKEAAAQQLENTKEYVRSSLAEARSSIWNLRSSESGAESETLPARLAGAIKSRQPESGSGPVLRLDVQGSFRPVGRRVEDEFLRIGQEAVSNALRHAGASAVAVVLSYDTDWLKLTVSDDGKGFDSSSVGAGHYGLQGMQERAAGIGATLKIESEAGMGTAVELTCEIAGRKATP